MGAILTYTLLLIVILGVHYTLTKNAVTSALKEYDEEKEKKLKRNEEK